MMIMMTRLSLPIDCFLLVEMLIGWSVGWWLNIIDHVKFGGWWVKYETMQAVSQCATFSIYWTMRVRETGDENDRDPDAGIQVRHSPMWLTQKRDGSAKYFLLQLPSGWASSQRHNYKYKYRTQIQTQYSIGFCQYHNRYTPSGFRQASTRTLSPVYSPVML